MGGRYLCDLDAAGDVAPAVTVPLQKGWLIGALRTKTASGESGREGERQGERERTRGEEREREERDGGGGWILMSLT